MVNLTVPKMNVLENWDERSVHLVFIASPLDNLAITGSVTSGNLLMVPNPDNLRRSNHMRC